MISRSERFAHHADWFSVGLYVGLIIGLLMVFSAIDAQQVTVYGRNSCGFTQNLRNQLDANKVEYTYCNIDSAGCLGAMFQVAIEFNLAVNGTVNLPVVLVVVYGKRYGYVRPSLATITQITAVDATRSPTIAYPNPAGQFITVDGDCEIYDLTGKCVLKSHYRHISIALLPQGIYFVRVGNKTTKIIKQ